MCPRHSVNMVERHWCLHFVLLKVMVCHLCFTNAVGNQTNQMVFGRSRDNILHFYRERMIDASDANGTQLNRVKRYDSPKFPGHTKTREERWHLNFNVNSTYAQMEQTQSLVNLLNRIVDKYLSACIPIILYDRFVEESDGIVLQTFFQSLKISYLHGKINDNYTIINQNLLHPFDKRCRSYILFLSDVLRTREVLGPQTDDRVLLIPRSTQWKLQEFLSSKASSDIINLLVIGESLSNDGTKDKPYVLYTHRLYTDGLGSNTPVVLTSWIKGKLSRPHVNLFPPKFQDGFAGHRFTVAAIHQPPFVIKKLSTDGGGNIQIDWDGLEIRVLSLLGNRLNFTYRVVEPRTGNELGPTYGVIDLVQSKRADIGIAGAFLSTERMYRVEMSSQHSTDCAAFITMASKALPRYRAIMGPFQWPVWLAIIATYLFAIFPLTFSDRMTLRHLIGNWTEIENMFWYMFGTFTNSLTFKGENSWSRSKKSSTRLLIGFYWMFSIIITACYTSSIIAFVTLPMFPKTIDSISDLIYGSYRIGTFANDGWQYWFTNSSHVKTKKLLKNLELVADIEEGLNNVTSAFFWGYAFLGSRTQLEYIIQTNFSNAYVTKQSAMHIGDECLSIFGISYMFPHDSVYSNSINDAILQLTAYGHIIKFNREIEWELQRGDSGRLLLGSKGKKFSLSDVEERKLNLADTEGMFLLMAIGYVVAGAVLVSEIVGGCTKRCREIVSRNSEARAARLNAKKRASDASQPDERTVLPSHERFRKLVARHFRRNSDQPTETKSNAGGERPNRHSRSHSIAPVSNECWVKQNMATDMHEITIENENDNDVYDSMAYVSDQLTPSPCSNHLSTTNSTPADIQFGEPVD